MPSKTKPKITKPKEDDKEQSARFIATARKLDVDESIGKFEAAIKSLVPPKASNRKSVQK